MSDNSLDPDLLRAPTLDAAGRRKWIYPDRRDGRLVKIRRALAVFLMAIYLIVPFSTFQGRPLLRFDVLDNKVYFLSYVFPFHDASYFVFVFIVLALLLFFVTALYGRLWCGYACPQTVFVEWLIRPIEELIEGNFKKRQIRDKGPWTFDKVWRKALKYLCYTIVIGIISNAFLAFFIDPAVLADWVTSSPAEHPWAFGFMLTLSILMFLDLVWFREQFCSFICPYARFQSVMIDNETPTIAYDAKRGEPRGRKAGAGDCINCHHCVRVCPTGIDIRQGLQLECIQCGRCADACDQIMTNLKRDKGLIRTASINQLAGIKTSRWRMRPILYFVGLVITFGVLTARMSTREDLLYTFMRQQGTTYAKLPDGNYANFFQIRVNNQTTSRHRVQIESSAGVRIICSICGSDVKGFKELKGNLVIAVSPAYSEKTVTLILDGKYQEQIPLILPQN